MKRKIILSALLAAVLCFSGCGKKDTVHEDENLRNITGYDESTVESLSTEEGSEEHEESVESDANSSDTSSEASSSGESSGEPTPSATKPILKTTSKNSTSSKTTTKTTSSTTSKPKTTVSSKNETSSAQVSEKDKIHQAFTDYIEDETEAYFIYDDFDNNGSFEAFGITGEKDSGGNYYDVNIYYISNSADVRQANSDEFGGTLATFDGSNTLSAGSSKFVVWNENYYGSGSTAHIYGVRNGALYEPSVSGEYEAVSKSGDEFIFYESTTGAGRSSIEHHYTFNSDNGEFTESDNGSSTTNSDSWMSDYKDYINSHPTSGNGTYWLIDVNGDGIDELFIDGGIHAEGVTVCTWSDGEVNTIPGGLNNIYLIDGENAFDIAGGNMGYYFDKVYTISNGEFVMMGSGTYTEAFDDESSDFVYEYMWNGETVTEDEYNDGLESLFDKDSAVAVTDYGKKYDLDGILYRLSLDE